MIEIFYQKCLQNPTFGNENITIVGDQFQNKNGQIYDVYCQTNKVVATESNTSFTQKNRNSGYTRRIARFDRPCFRPQGMEVEE